MESVRISENSGRTPVTASHRWRRFSVSGGVYMTTDIYKKIEQNKYNIRISELNALKELYQVGYGELFQTDS